MNIFKRYCLFLISQYSYLFKQMKQKKHKVGDQCTCDKCKDWKTYGKWFSFIDKTKNGNIIMSSVHYPPEAFMTKDERIEYFKEIEIDIKEHPEKYTIALAYRKMMGIKTRSPNGEYKK